MDFAKEEDLVFLCGHYEGIDERVLEEVVTDYVSIGDYVLTGGELPAMVMIDAISRMVPGVLSNGESGTIESFHDNLLEYPQYTRPEVWESKKVPDMRQQKVLGYSRVQTFFRIILPQVIKRVLPAVTNEMITLVKDTSLAFVLTVTEMFTIAKQIAAAQASVMPLMAAGVFYYIFNLVVAVVMEHVEKKLNYYRG